jgi:hypothetical protein
MPFIQIKSNLANLKFGNDQPGYGSSGLPYIKFTPPTQTISDDTFNQNSVFFSSKYSDIGAIGSVSNLNPGPVSQQTELYNALRTSLDYPIRGGAIDFQIGQQTYTLSSKIDAERIKAFFQDKSKGTNFINKQIGLQLTNPKMETGNTLFGLGQSFPIPGLLENTRVYNKGINTLAQVGVSGTGAHALRHGLVPFAPFQKHYFAIVNAQNVNNDKITNRLVNLNALKMTSSETSFVNPTNVFDINTVNNLGISLNRNLLFQYLGGPGSTYGVGATTITRTVDTTKLRSSTAMTYDKIKDQSSNKGNVVVSQGEKGTLSENIINKTTYGIQDFRIGLDGIGTTFTAWGDKTVENRFYASPGKYRDKMNSSYPFLFNNSKAPWEIGGEETDDIIKFVFEAISNDNSDFSTAIFFRAFLTAGITDNHSAQLNSFKYMGRGENFYTYQGFDRNIGFSFRIAAGSKQELKPMYNRLNALISQVYPDYSPQTNIMRAPLMRISIGDYIYRMPGFIESINVTVDNGNPWEINLDGDSAQLPQVLDVAVTFKPILDELPRRLGTDIKFRSLGNYSIETNSIEEVSDARIGVVPKLIANTDKNFIDTDYSNPLTPVSFTTKRELSAQEKNDLLARQRTLEEEYSIVGGSKGN